MHIILMSIKVIRSHLRTIPVLSPLFRVITLQLGPDPKICHVYAVDVTN